MNTDFLKDPNNKLYLYCALASVAVMVGASIVSLIYIVAATPSEGYILTKDEDSIGTGMPLICGIIFVLCLALLIRDLRKRLDGCPPEQRDERLMSARISKAGMLFSITALTSVVVILISILIGEEISESFIDEMTDYEIMVSMMCAGPEEEFLCRILLIGIPVFIAGLILKHEHCGKYLLGGFGMSKLALVFLVISAIIFGLLHLDGWSIMKFPDTFISGMMFGYVYIQYGAHTSIVMHSAFDLIASFDVFYDGIGTAAIILMVAFGIVLLTRSLFKLKDYIPKNGMNEPFEGGVIAMWERD